MTFGKSHHKTTLDCRSSEKVNQHKDSFNTDKDSSDENAKFESTPISEVDLKETPRECLVSITTFKGLGFSIN